MADKLVVEQKTNKNGLAGRDVKGRFVKGIVRKNKTNKNGLAGRPLVMTKETIAKLEQAFAIGASDEEACAFAEIAESTLYKYQERHPDFLERKRRLKELPMLKARQTIVNDLIAPETAKWYAARKKKDEFSERSELTGKDGKDIDFVTAVIEAANDKARGAKPKPGSTKK